MIRRPLLLALLAAGSLPGLVMAQAKPPVAPLTPGPAVAPAAKVTPVAPASASTAAPAIPALSMPAQGAPLLSAAPSASTPATSSPAASSPAEESIPTDLDATAVRQAAHLKAQIDLEKLRTELQNQQQTRESAKKKFDDEQSGKADKDGKPLASVGTAQIQQAPRIRPYAASVYAFGERSYAQVVIDGATFLAIPGKTLPNGDKVISINENGVVLNQHGRRVTVPVQSSSMLPSGL